MKKLMPLFFAVFSFTGLMANDLSWNSPTTLSTALQDASEPQIVMDVDGNTTAAWVENGFIKASYLPVGGSWGAVNTISAASSSSPRLAVDGSGNVMAVWLESGVVRTATASGGTWGSSTALSGLGTSSSPVVALRNNGDAVVVWERGGFIEAKTKTFLGLWSLASVLSGADADNPDVAVGGDGTTVVVWHRRSSGADVVQSASSILGGAWGTVKSLLQLSAAYSYNYPKVAVDVNGNATALVFAYQTYGTEYINVSLYGTIYPKNASTWLALPVRLAGPGLRNPADLVAELSYDTIGNIMAIWTMSYDNSSFSLESSMKLLGGDWSPVIKLVEDNLYSFAGSIQANSLSDVVAAYMLTDGSSLTIESTEANISGINTEVYWSPSQVISVENENAYPVVASSYSSSVVRAAVAWLSYDGANTVLQVAVGSRDIIDPPLNVAVSQGSIDFGVYTDYTNTVTWDPSASAGVVEYDVFRNGIFFQRVNPNDTLEVIEHNTDPLESITYGVTAIDNQLTQSETITAVVP